MAFNVYFDTLLHMWYLKMTNYCWQFMFINNLQENRTPVHIWCCFDVKGYEWTYTNINNNKMCMYRMKV